MFGIGMQNLKIQSCVHLKQNVIIVHAFGNVNVIMCYVWLITSHLKCDIIVCYVRLIVFHIKYGDFYNYNYKNYNFYINK